MSEPILLYFDYVDPLWFVAERAARVLEERGSPVHRRPFELKPPPKPLLAPTDPEIERRRSEARWRDPETSLATPPLIPWTRKAHELALHAKERGSFARVHTALAEAHLCRARDIGRVDVLLDLAVECGLDGSETKAVLDVDRFRSEVEASREEAVARGVRSTPTFVLRDQPVWGVPDRQVLIEWSGHGVPADDDRTE